MIPWEQSDNWELVDLLSPERYVAGMYLEFIVAIIAISIWILMLHKFFQKKSQFAKFLMLAYLGYLIMLLSTLIEKILVIFRVINYPDIIYNVRIGIVGGFGAMIFVYFYTLFIYEFLLNQKKWAKLVVRGYQILVVIFALYAIFIWFLPMSNQQYDFFFLPIAIFSMVALIPLFVASALAPIQIIKKLPDPTTIEEKASFISLKSISINSVIVLLFILLYGIDVSIPFLGMTILYFIAWTLSAISFIFAYFGYFQPKWILKKIHI